MEVSGWVYFGGFVVFFGGMFAYAMFMIFLPEWVGIAGKTSRAAEAAHRGLTAEELELADSTKKEARDDQSEDEENK